MSFGLVIALLDELFCEEQDLVSVAKDGIVLKVLDALGPLEEATLTILHNFELGQDEPESADLERGCHEPVVWSMAVVHLAEHLIDCRKDLGDVTQALEEIEDVDLLRVRSKLELVDHHCVT